MLSQRRPNTNVTNDIKITWVYQDKIWWDTVCVKVIEAFGTPGKKYITSVCENHLIFKFHSDKDATMCRLLLSEFIQ
jgi:hypothetical protein